MKHINKILALFILATVIATSSCSKEEQAISPIREEMKLHTSPTIDEGLPLIKNPKVFVPVAY